MAKGYTTKINLERYTLQTIDASFDAQITSWIESIEKFIEKYTGRIFIADTTASEKVYDGEGGSKQKFDEFISLTKVEIGEDTKTEIESDNYRIYPNNDERKNKIQLKENYFTKGYQNVTITAKWGYSINCPADLTLAATTLLAGIINYSNDAKGKIRSESIGRYTVAYTDDQGWQDFKRAMMILNSYKQFHF